MLTPEFLFWAGAALVLYTYAGYPLLIWAIVRLLRPAPPRHAPFAGSLSIIVAARNEAARITGRLKELTELLEASGWTGEIIVVSDNSSDDTAELARSFGDRGVRVIELPEHVGKAAALSEACALAEHDILVFADARQRWARDALEKLLRNFADPRVGAVSGELVVESGSGVVAGVGLYWRYEKNLRYLEGRLYSTVGATGAISAVRRDLFRPIPPGTILDDVYWPLQVVMQGHRVIHEREARAFDRLPPRPRDEFRRKVRTLSGNFQLVARAPAVVLPWRNPIWFQFISHKLMRLVVPWALLTMLISSALSDQLPYRQLFFAQVAGYVLGLLGLCVTRNVRGRMTVLASSFVVLNVAAWLAFWVFISGRASRSWRKVDYSFPTPSVSTATPDNP